MRFDSLLILWSWWNRTGQKKPLGKVWTESDITSSSRPTVKTDRHFISLLKHSRAEPATFFKTNNQAIEREKSWMPTRFSISFLRTASLSFLTSWACFFHEIIATFRSILTVSSQFDSIDYFISHFFERSFVYWKALTFPRLLRDFGIDYWRLFKDPRHSLGYWGASASATITQGYSNYWINKSKS